MLVFLLNWIKWMVNNIFSRHNQKNLKICFCNVQGLTFFRKSKNNSQVILVRKMKQIKDYISNHSPDVVILCETWLKKSIIFSDVLNNNEYKIIRHDRTNYDKRLFKKIGGGGILLLVKKASFKLNKIIINKNNLPFCASFLHLNNNVKIGLLSIYRYPYAKQFFDNKMSEFLKKALQKRIKFIIIGDFNLKSIQTKNEHQLNNENITSLDCFNKHTVKQLINKPTHIKGRTLDLLMATDSLSISNLTVNKNRLCDSDHFTVEFTVET